MRSRKKSAGRLMAAMAAALMLTATGCNTSGCNDNRSSIPLAGFYSSGDEKAIRLDCLDIGGVGAPNDSLLLAAGESATEVFLPLRHTTDCTTFFIEYKDKAQAGPGITDYLEFGYEAIPFFASEECGAMYRYHITSLDYTRNIIDSVAIIAPDSMITNVEKQYLKIFFRTSEGGDPQQ